MVEQRDVKCVAGASNAVQLYQYPRVVGHSTHYVTQWHPAMSPRGRVVAEDGGDAASGWLSLWEECTSKPASSELRKAASPALPAAHNNAMYMVPERCAAIHVLARRVGCIVAKNL